MKTIKNNLWAIFCIGGATDIVGLALLITNVIEDVSVGLTILAIGLITIGLLLEIAVVLIWLTPRIMRKLLENKGVVSMSWEEKKMTYEVRFHGILIETVRCRFNYPISVVPSQDGDSWEVNPA